MSPGVSPPSLLLLTSLVLVLCVCRTSSVCLQDTVSAYRWTGAVCRLTHRAAVVLNEKTPKVIEAAFKHTTYPSVKRHKSVMFIGTITYGLDNLEIHNLSIGRSAFELRPGEGIAMEISNVSAIFRGTVHYSSQIAFLTQSLDFEVESEIDLGINPKLYCGNGKVAADTSDCYLNFHKLRLHLQGDKEPNWLKKLFTDFITFTVKLLLKSQICKEINKVANILADFIQDTAEQFLSDGNISVDIGVTAAPVVTDNYVESYHKGVTTYLNSSAHINNSNFLPTQLTDNRMLYFWLSDQVLNPMISAAHKDGRFRLTISGAELIELFNTSLCSKTPEFIRKCLWESESPELTVWTSSVPFINTSTSGTTVWAESSGHLTCGRSQNTSELVFQTAVVIDVRASYSEKKVFLQGNNSKIFVSRADLTSRNQSLVDEVEFIREAVEKIGVPLVLSVFQTEITRLLDKQGTNLFDIFDPEVIPQDGFTLIQMDFGFPHHLLVQFLKKTLQ